MYNEFAKKVWNDDDWSEVLSAEPDGENFYFSKIAFNKIKKRTSNIYNSLEKDLLEIKDTEQLKEMYTAFFDKLWNDICFIAYGARNYDMELNQALGFPIPKWLKKGLTIEELEDVKKTNVNLLSYSEPKGEALYYLRKIIKKSLF